ncbi:SpoIIE family protein phosphatase [Streptomyces litchfieldiae]|uniref:SpoIIE family protein phosphatase n=1 Tax=Streptomyces litchfieldiae TaxID=3075543 RepID=A0ABU2MRT6_9ACTN|nr:SpoIIE family protein phosphatase [Streptomyces sp. DSM 44938]MDT0343814.1 SpoIIE family protein phosphatase [Streptomyces sp. DSM 44938]
MPYPGDLDGPPGGAAVVLLLGERGEVVAGTPGSERLTGRPVADLYGRRLADLLAGPAPWPDLDELADLGEPGHGTVSLRLADGGTAEVRLDVLPIAADHGPRQLVTLTPRATARHQEEDRGMLRALFSQTRVGLAIHDAELRVTRMNSDPSAIIRDQPFPAPLAEPTTLHELMIREDADAILEQLGRVAATGEPLAYWEHSARLLAAPDQDRVLAVSALQLQDESERLLGVVSVFTDITEQHLARRRMALLHTAAQRIGPTLDVTRNAEELTGVLVPDFADLAAVDLSAAVLTGDEPGPVLQGAPLRRVAASAASAADSHWPIDVARHGATFRIDNVAEDLRHEGGVLREAEVSALRPRPLDNASGESARPGELLPTTPGSRMVLPLRARGQILGSLALWRAATRPPFTRSDADLAEEIGSRAALSVDNARRYTREHRTLETLQRSLLPRPVFEVSAAHTAGSYVPAGTAAGIGGGWYDVIPLSSTRVAFVIGDVAGHGLGATATMGRLRTAVQTLADLDLAPDELLTRLDDLAIRLADVDGSRGGAVGATCLYCVYDPVTGQCAMAAASRVPPVVARPGEPPAQVPLKAGPPLGTGGHPFETVRLPLPPDSLLLFFSEELVAHAGENDDGARERRLGELRDRVAEGLAAGSPPAAVGQSVLDTLLPGRAPANDVALLVARVQALPDGSTADWEFPAEPAIVGEARDAVLTQLKDWDLTGNAFPTELIVSELLTNAIRYAGGPVGLRLIRNETLICEVSDPSETQPHLRRARPTDEGGRGLFLIAQLAHRWGSRYTTTGKTIWTEQLLDRG